MKYITGLLLLSLLIGCKGKQQVRPDVDAPGYSYIQTPTGKWELVWDEEFDYEGLPDSTKWSYDTEGNDWGWGNNEAQFYTDRDSSNAYVKDGKLTITALKKEAGGKQFTSARLRTKEKGDWLYGRFEVSAKLPSALGSWPAIWMLPSDWNYGGWPHSGEIDIMENVGYDPDTIIATVHTLKYHHSIGTQKNGKLYLPDSRNNFHLYALEWEEDECRFYIDDKEIFKYVNDGEGFESWPFDQRYHLLLNLAVGGDWGGLKGIDSTAFPLKYDIDYVRVYKKID